MTLPVGSPGPVVLFDGCPLCGVTGHDHVFDHPECGEVVDCRGCGLRYTRSRRLSSWAAIRRETPGPLLDVFIEKEADQVRDFRAILGRLHELGARGPLLDVGSMTGHFLSEARSAGFDTVGIEPDPWAAGYARREFGLDIREELLTEAAFEPGSFGVVSMLHVMEHLTDPKETLAVIHRTLADDGILAVEIPIIDATATRIMGRRHRHYVFDHTLFMTRTTCARFLEEAGFRIVRREATGRTLRLGRLARGMAVRSPQLGGAVSRAVETLRLDRVHLTVNLRDILRVYAVKRQATSPPPRATFRAPRRETAAPDPGTPGHPALGSTTRNGRRPRTGRPAGRAPRAPLPRRG
ncbi:MAG: class I SAM-dependent methyltransferase [Acidimicrobiia bacterium]|nr:class I SAM-dependent methyltransferase [Acidimicrobiia bacterium]